MAVAGYRGYPYRFLSDSSAADVPAADVPAALFPATDFPGAVSPGTVSLFFLCDTLFCVPASVVLESSPFLSLPDRISLWTRMKGLRHSIYFLEYQAPLMLFEWPLPQSFLRI
jgi:hypothetical protein